MQKKGVSPAATKKPITPHKHGATATNTTLSRAARKVNNSARVNAFAMARLVTPIDRLVEYVKLKKSTTVEEASKALSVPSKEVEELAEILAESGLINLKYEFSGIRLTPKLVKADEAKPGDGGAKGKGVLERVNSVEQELKSASDMFAFSEKDISRRVEAVRAHFREIEALELKGEEVEPLKRKTLALMSQTRVLEDNVEALRKQAAGVEQEMASFNQRLEAHPQQRKGIIGRIKGAFSKVAARLRRKKA